MRIDDSIDGDLHETASRVRDLGRRVDLDPIHKARLREELSRRHLELYADHNTTQRAAFSLWPRIARLKRLTLVAPPALAVSVALIALGFALQVSGHQKAQTAEAARITQAFARAVPSITTWRWTLHARRGNSAEVLQFRASLNPNQALRFYYEGPYLYYRGHWNAVTWDLGRVATIVSPTDWEWAFAVLPSLLKGRHSDPLIGPSIEGRKVEGFTHSVSSRTGTVSVTAWVDQTSGLVLRLDRQILRQSRVLEQDRVDYTYAPGTK